ncbi:hypothetical protein [Prosthecobacter fluviatilis]|uniref:Lipoprotein n=1 Tax=Prosthecobacter fluviatilis TaxID=445931 RepID=A0ABW0KUF6_9BACT
MKIPAKWTLMLWACLLAACSTKPVPDTEAAPTQEPRLEAPPGETRGGPQVVVLGPDGQARVLVTARGSSLQRRPDGPLQLLDTPVDDVEEERWAEKAKELAEGVHWSPSGAQVCLLRGYKRGSDIVVFTLTTQPAAEVKLDLHVLEKAIEERYGNAFKMGRFYYISLRRWIDDDHLEIEFSGNLVPKVVPKVETSPEVWGYYKGTACVEIKAKSGLVKGELKWEPLKKEEVR